MLRYDQMFPPVSADAFLDPSYRGPCAEVLESSSAHSVG